MNANLERFQGVQQQQVNSFYHHMVEGLDEMAEFYKLFTTANETFLDGLKETLQIVINPINSESIAQWPKLIDHNIQRAVKLNQACLETTKTIQARVTKNMEEEIPAYSQQFLDSVEQLAQVIGRTAETSGKGVAGGSAAHSQSRQHKSRHA